MRILVGLIEHLGDIVACEPVARYLKAEHPSATLAWAVSGRFRELVESNPNIDEVVVLDCLTEWIKLSRHGGYDRIVDLHVNLRVCEHCRVPLVKQHGNPLVDVSEWFDYGAILEAFSIGAGLPRLSAQPKVYIGDKHRAAVDALGLPDRFAVIHRQSTARAKDWTDQKWQRLIEFMQGELGLSVVDVGVRKTGRFRSAAPDFIDLYDRLSILETAEVIRRSVLFAGVDSGPAHLANALEKPGVVLLGRYLNFRSYTPFTGFYASDNPAVKIVRNLTGDVRAIGLNEVRDAVRYVATVADAASGVPRAVAVAATPTPAPPSLLRRLSAAVSRRGRRERRQRNIILASGYFDAAWYVLHYPEAVGSGLSPVDHFIRHGADMRASPGAAFDSEWYLATYPDVVAGRMNPLLHFLLYGQRAGRPARPVGTLPAPAATSALRAAEEEAAIAPPVPQSGGTDGRPLVLAFYLPQFHPISENDWAHGPGFTEWHNVVKAKPQFLRHYQPRIPGELGYYDLRAGEILRQQAALAQEHGVSGFCFYYYYFAGKKVLFEPIRSFLDSDIDMPFTLLWANENWSRRWDGGDREVIVEQHHSAADDLMFIRELADIFRDRRYVKIGGRPVLTVYKTHLLADPLRTTEAWRSEAERLGFPGLYLVMADDWGPQVGHPRELGFDACYEIPSNLLPDEVLADTDEMEIEPDFEGKIVDYAKFATYHLSRPVPDYRRFRTVMLPWDNTARYGERAIVHVNGMGRDYRRWLIEALVDTARRYEQGERIVFLHSWNEWCEGTYLEPDGKYGRHFLEETRAATGIASAALAWAGDPKHGELVADLLAIMAAKEEGYYRGMRSYRRRMDELYSEKLGLEAAEKAREAARATGPGATLRRWLGEADTPRK